MNGVGCLKLFILDLVRGFDSITSSCGERMMKKVVLVTLLFAMTSVAAGEVSTRVCRADGLTPGPEDPNIMVGTKLTIIVSSDAGSVDPYPVDLLIMGDDRDYGVLSAGMGLPDAGGGAMVYSGDDDLYQGFYFQTDENVGPGDWFIVDYTATAIGDCNIGFYEWFMLTYEIPFTHVRTRDFDDNTKVNLVDFATLAFYWQRSDCSDPDRCGGADLDINDSVNIYDLMLFVDYWLEYTE